MSLASILALADQARAAHAHPERQYPLHVGLSCEALIEAAREIEEMRAQLGAAMGVVDAARGLSRCSPGLDVEDVSEAAGRVDADVLRLAEAHLTIDDLRDEIKWRKASEEDARRLAAELAKVRAIAEDARAAIKSHLGGEWAGVILARMGVE